jgi:hypothetical protein
MDQGVLPLVERARRAVPLPRQGRQSFRLA